MLEQNPTVVSINRNHTLKCPAFQRMLTMNALLRLILEWLRWLVFGHMNGYCLPDFTVNRNYQPKMNLFKG